MRLAATWVALGFPLSVHALHVYKQLRPSETTVICLPLNLFLHSGYFLVVLSLFYILYQLYACMYMHCTHINTHR